MRKVYSFQQNISIVFLNSKKNPLSSLWMLTGIQKSHPSHFSKNRIWSWILKYIGYWSHIVIKIKTYTIPSQEILLTSAWLEACGKMTSILPLFLFDKQNLKSAVHNRKQNSCQLYWAIITQKQKTSSGLPLLLSLSPPHTHTRTQT